MALRSMMLIIALLATLLTSASPAAAAYPVKGAIGSHWKELGGASGPLGSPIGNEGCGLKEGGCYQSFAKGSIHWTSGTGAHHTLGGIRSFWKNKGWERGTLGYPIGEEYDVSGGRAQKFQGGTVTWKRGSGTSATYQANNPRFTVKGRGYGHGVGMSQYGARGMAAEGRPAWQILEHYYNPAKVTSVSSAVNDDLKVQLLGGQSKVTMRVTQGEARLRIGSSTYPVSGTLEVTTASSGKAVAVTSGGTTRRASDGQAIWLEWRQTRAWSGGGRTIVEVDKANGGSATGRYRHGRIELAPFKGKVEVTAALRLGTEYLYGVAEMPSTWAPEALKAQAVVARTFALRERTIKKSDCRCQVYDEVRSQKFTGWAKEAEGSAWPAAIRATATMSGDTVTRAQAVTYSGAPINAVYSSSSGGKTNDSKDVWGSSTPYLRSRDDRWSSTAAAGNPNANWTHAASQAQMAKVFGLPEVRRVTVSLASSGLARSATATSASGKTVTVTGAKLRSALGLKSSTVTIATVY